jgi:hypothetical protein
METTIKPVDTGSVAYQSHEEFSGFSGMPQIDRTHFEKPLTQPTIVLAPGEIVAIPQVVVPES